MSNIEAAAAASQSIWELMMAFQEKFPTQRNGRIPIVVIPEIARQRDHPGPMNTSLSKVYQVLPAVERDVRRQ